MAARSAVAKWATRRSARNKASRSDSMGTLAARSAHGQILKDAASLAQAPARDFEADTVTASLPSPALEYRHRRNRSGGQDRRGKNGGADLRGKIGAKVAIIYRALDGTDDFSPPQGLRRAASVRLKPAGSDKKIAH